MKKFNHTSLVLTFSLAGLLAASTAAFAKHDNDDLPPGLQKKASQGKPLPAGWQKKYHRGDVLDRDIYSRGTVVVPLDDKGLVTINIEGTLFRLNQKTREIFSVITH